MSWDSEYTWGEKYMATRPLKAGSVFTGCGGMDLGFSRCGIETVWMCERDRQARQLLRMKYPNTPIYHDVRHLIEDDDLPPVDLIHGGDPCPRHSRARQTATSTSPDLSGYFLALVGRHRPRWVVRENVLASTVGHFAIALEALGYGVVVIGIDGAEITGQSRPREFVVGLREAGGDRVRELFQDAVDGRVLYQAPLQRREVSPCLCTNPRRLSYGEMFIWDSGRLRVLDCEERERLAGLPSRWTEGFSREARARFTGNAVIPAMAQWIGRRIVQQHGES